MNTVPVKITPDVNPTFDPERMASACKELGLVHMPTTAIKMLQVVGEEIERAGAIRVSSAGVFVSQQWCLRSMEKMANDIEATEDPETKANMARAIGYLANAVTRAAKQIVDASPEAVGELGAKSLRASFAPFAVVTNIQNAPPAKPEHVIEVDSVSRPSAAVHVSPPGPEQAR